MSEKIEYCVIKKEEIQDFIARCIMSVGSSEAHARTLAECLIAGDYRGHFSHGLNRTYTYIKDLIGGAVNSNENPVIEKESPATALVDGRNLLGPIVGNFSMQLAIKKAKEVGIGIVTAYKSNHYGIAGYYSLQALKENLIGLSFTNASPILVPTRASVPTFGTNPISFAAPAKNDDSFVLDMATSAVAYGKVEIHNRKNIPIPPFWGVDKNGKPTTSTEEIMTDGGLLPLGGTEESSGYKGYGLAFMVDILCGVLSGANYGPHIRKWKNSGIANLGQCFIAINPENFADGFNDRLQDVMDYCRNMEPVDKDKPVLVAGDPERAHMKKCDDLGGIPYHPNQYQYALDLAKEHNLEPPKVHAFVKL